MNTPQVTLPGGQNTLFNHDAVAAAEEAGAEILAIDDPANTWGESIAPFVVNPPDTCIGSTGVDILLPRGLFWICISLPGIRNKAAELQISQEIRLLRSAMLDDAIAAIFPAPYDRARDGGSCNVAFKRRFEVIEFVRL